MFLVVSEIESIQFKQFASANVEIIYQEELSKYLATSPVNGIRKDYINQEIIKLSFWELQKCHHYFTLDSDFIFLNDFTLQTFFTRDKLPKYVLVEDKELISQPKYFNDFWINRSIELNKIKKALDIESHELKTCHNGTIFSSSILQSLKNNFMDKNNLSYRDLLSISPYEFSWYNYWLQKISGKNIYHGEPFFKIFHNYDQILGSIIQGVNEESIKNSYLGVCINSNFSRAYGQLSLDTMREEILAQSFSFITILKILFYKTLQLKNRVLSIHQNRSII